jgi:acetyl-CoA carboxylase biotin carboxyl carrier protein
MVAKNTSSSKRASHPKAVSEVKALARVLRQFDLSSIEVETEALRVKLERSSSSTLESAWVSSTTAESRASIEAAADAPAPAAEHGGANPNELRDGHIITSPLVGTFYRAPSPESASFVEVGQSVRKGQTLCIIEAMKLMNEIEADTDGCVVEILVGNGHAVEYGQPLFRLEPA